MINELPHTVSHTISHTISHTVSHTIPHTIPHNTPILSEMHLRVTSFDDMKRDVLKSDSAMVVIPELDLELQHGTLGGLYTTVEGLLGKIYKNLSDDHPFAGDSSTNNHSEDEGSIKRNRTFQEFLSKLKDLKDGKVYIYTHFTINTIPHYTTLYHTILTIHTLYMGRYIPLLYSYETRWETASSPLN